MALKIAVVGAGYLGQHHARIYSELPETDLVGVVDIDGARAREVAQRYGSHACQDYREILDDVDALSIVVPTTDHFDVALTCVRKGKDILVEKPITATLPQADALIAEAENMKRILQVGHLERYNPGVIALSRMIEEAGFIEAVRRSPFLNRCADVDVTLDLMIHDIDIIFSLIPSPVKRMQAFGFSLMTEKIDEARAWMEFENGTVASLISSRISKEKERKMKVFQKDSCLELDYQEGVVEIRSRKNPANPEIIRPEYREPLKEELKDFIHCVLHRERPKVSGAEGRAALQMALEITALAGGRS